jgi:hypothetical protein
MPDQIPPIALSWLNQLWPNVYRKCQAIAAAEVSLALSGIVSGGKVNVKALSGSPRLAIHNTYVSVTLTPGDDLVVCFATLVVALPVSSFETLGQVYHIKNSGTGVVTIVPTGGQTVDGYSSYPLASQWVYATVCSDGANWVLI